MHRESADDFVWPAPVDSLPMKKKKKSHKQTLGHHFSNTKTYLVTPKKFCSEG